MTIFIATTDAHQRRNHTWPESRGQIAKTRQPSATHVCGDHVQQVHSFVCVGCCIVSNNAEAAKAHWHTQLVFILPLFGSSTLVITQLLSEQNTMCHNTQKVNTTHKQTVKLSTDVKLARRRNVRRANTSICPSMVQWPNQKANHWQLPKNWLCHFL